MPAAHARAFIRLQNKNYISMDKRKDTKMNTAIATQNSAMTQLEKVIIQGDLSVLTAEDKVKYYKAVCESVGLNPLTQPFAYLRLSNKLVLYALKAGTDQLRALHEVSVYKMETKTLDGVYEVIAYARNAEGREDVDMGAWPIANLKGEQLVNAKLKAVTKAKRRVTLSLCGLGMLDESEIDTIPDAILEEPPAQPALIAEEKKPNGNGREKIIQIVTDLDRLIRELRKYGISNADIQARMKDLVGVDKRADLNEGQMVACIEEFEDWAARLEMDRKGGGK